ncbi:MAG: DUF1080 domain-containing protein [Sedimentisphaerales bacterium]|nr:DUF1080 domain-containing protein [Sedimentisphaerales bacterium]
MKTASIGYILLVLCVVANADIVDDFESGDLSKWSLDIWNNWGQVIAWDLVQDGTQVWQGSGGFPVPLGGGGNSAQYLAGFNDGDVSVTARVKTQTIIHPGTWSGIVARYSDPSHFYVFHMSGDSVDAENLLYLQKSDNIFTGYGWVGYQTLAYTTLVQNQLGVWNTLRLDVIGNHLTAYFNGTLYFDIYDNSLSSGSVGLTNSGGVTRFDDFSVTVVPLPGSVPLGCVGLGFAGWRLRRKAI